ncbi:RHS repeat-associated core domain-containing protein [Pseudomonas fitomaticsae]|uniref:RHS repeat-associated core domain-containing protein n=1 Tax=Pseudomonas fitomaticsae TaxID=2837969 RepID=A0ABY3PYM7_9PSED|nr:RHS repeat-associated core domain-containing protein [Pseudomonas fitomaticsae]UFP99053.1 RHS repeat-associated core domain-containing protein [Pseudomonas fitomaticsae]
MTPSPHEGTPSLSVYDSRGLEIRQVAYLRSIAGATAEALITRQQRDALGHVVKQWDPRLASPAITNVFNLTAGLLETDSVDAGKHRSLPGVTGETLQRWDARNHHWQHTYDDQLRLVAVAQDTGPDNETYVYANASADAGYNRRGQMVEINDPSGSVKLHSFALTGAALQESRTFHDGLTFSSQHNLSPLGALLKQTDAGGHQRHWAYDVAGQLTQVQLKVHGQLAWQPVLRDAQYNATGQIILQRTGNDVSSHWHYRAADGRLLRQYAQKATGESIQDLGYEYDRMGNITRILDHAYTPTYFRNQRVDGHREFRYDSTYRLIHASGYDEVPPTDNPGLPQPTDPNDRRNYTETYEYDHGDNLVKTIRVRDGANHTFQVYIDPDSNRGVRWRTGDPIPVFPTEFDAAGNQLKSPRGPLQWNSRNQLDCVTLVRHPTGPHDTEQYRYSQDVRVHKRLETHAPSVSHFRDVRYLPDLEIHTSDNGEELHVIKPGSGAGDVTCLHWVKGKPTGIDQNQLRYIHKDHLGSSLKEVDQLARLISDETYYPFGNTSTLAARSRMEVDYKFIRYSGKKMDVTGLYYYGARYYAPWMGRWVSADPAGDVDGLNLYGFVGNNPLRYVDQEGKQKQERTIVDYSEFITVLGNYASSTMDLMDTVAHKKDIGLSLLKNFIGESIKVAVSYIAGYWGSQGFDFLLPDDPHVANFTHQTKPPFSQGLVGGNIAAEIAGKLLDRTPNARLIAPLVPQTSTLTVQAIDRKAGIDTSPKPTDWIPKMSLAFVNYVVGSILPVANLAVGMGPRLQEAEDIKAELDPFKLLKIDNMLDSWESAVRQHSANAEKAFTDLNQLTVGSGSQKITRRDLQAKTIAVLGMIESTRTTVSWMREDSTTDARYLRKQERAFKRANDRH